MVTARKRLSLANGLALTSLIAMTVAVFAGCGGNAGVDNGTVTGKVFSNFSRGVAGRVPEAGVAVAAQRDGEDPPVIRNVVTDANGEYIVSELPTGNYFLGFAKDGFQTVDVGTGATAQRTNIGNRIQLFVEPGAVSSAPEVTLRKLAGVGNSTVIITVLDQITGQPVNNATVTVGTATTSNGGNNGVYTLEVPVNVNNPDAPFGQPNSERILIAADGFQINNTNQIVPIADQTVRSTIALTADTAQILGIIRITQFELLYNKANITIRVANANNINVGPVIAQDGSFTITVPRSTPSLTRQFNLVFTHPGLETFTLSNVVAPVGGARTLSQVVEMRPRLVDVVGSVVDSFGQAPNNLGPVADTATIGLTGQQSTIINGTYTIPRVPVGIDGLNIGTGLVISIRVFNPVRITTGPPARNGFQERVDTAPFRPLTDTIFVVPLAITS